MSVTANSVVLAHLLTRLSASSCCDNRFQLANTCTSGSIELNKTSAATRLMQSRLAASGWYVLQEQSRCSRYNLSSSRGPVSSSWTRKAPSCMQRDASHSSKNQTHRCSKLKLIGNMCTLHCAGNLIPRQHPTLKHPEHMLGFILVTADDSPLVQCTPHPHMNVPSLSSCA